MSGEGRYRAEHIASGSETACAGELGGSPVDELFKLLEGKRSDDGRYSKLEEIGRGGMGVIHRAWDEELDREVALKVSLVVPGSAPGDSGVTSNPSLGRFFDEARVTGQLVHPGIVPVHELRLDESGAPCFAMQLVKGRELREIFECERDGDKEWSRTRVLVVILKVCEAMAYAHSKGVIHRDLKPGNVMVGKFGEVYVMDWGLARLLGRDDRQADRLAPDPRASVEVRGVREQALHDTPDSPLLTQLGDVIGTPAYMPPEQARGDVERMDRRADVYAVGAMLYELLARRMPYAPAEGRIQPHAVLAALLHGPPIPITEVAGDVPPELVAICDKAMARAPDDRFADMSELAADLAAYLEGRVVGAYESGAWAEAKKWLRRNRLAATALVLLVLAVAAGLGGVAAVQARGRRAAEAERNAAREAERVAVASELRAEVARADAEAAHDRAEAVLADLHRVVDHLAQPFPVATRFVRLDGDEARTLLPGELLTVGDRLALEVHCMQDLNFYVFNQDDTGVVQQIFPLPGLLPSNPLVDGRQYRIPRWGSWSVTRSEGTERFLLLALSPEVPFDREEWGLADRGVPTPDEDPTRSVGPSVETGGGTAAPLGTHSLSVFERLREAAERHGGAWVRILEYGAAKR